MDLLIISSALISFLFFLVVQIITFRLLGSIKILRGMYYSFFISSVLHFLFFFKSLDTVYFFVSYIIFIFMDLIFVWGIVGVATTSLRMQLLIEVDKNKSHGISYRRLLEKYNKKIIIKNRLKRLLVSGEIRKEGNYYLHNGRFSYFTIHLFLIQALNFLYNKSRYQF